MQGWSGSCRVGVGHAGMEYGGNYRLLNLEMPRGIKSDRTVMEMQDIESLTPKY